ncbi:MAG: hypothetical protein R2683_04110 [Bifidobacterium adolescentis]
MLEQQVCPREPVGQPFHNHSHEPLRASDYFSGYQTVSSEAVTFTPAVTKQVSAFCYRAVLRFLRIPNPSPAYRRCSLGLYAFLAQAVGRNLLVVEQQLRIAQLEPVRC